MKKRKKKISDRELKRRRYQSLCAKHGMPLLMDDSKATDSKHDINAESVWAVKSGDGFSLRAESEI